MMDPTHQHDITKQGNPPSIKFDIPLNHRTFYPFPRLPYELRHKIWKSILTPGMHFLKVEATNEKESVGNRWWTKSFGFSDAIPPSDDEEEVDEIVEEVKHEVAPTSSTDVKLAPLYQTTEAVISHSSTLNKQLAKLSAISAETAALAKDLASRPSVLKVDDGRIVSLDPRVDVIYLEYVPAEVFSSNFTLTRSLKCPEFAQIRRVAVRFCHGWTQEQSTRRCPHCGRFHGRTDKITYPRHLYHFLAQYLPNLEHFYFVDYLVLRKPDEEGDQMDVDGEEYRQAKSRPSCKFESGNRRYYEADTENWNVTSRVFEIKSWLQDRFVRYAKESKLSKHKNPESVKFGVLACEWSIEPPAETKTSPVKSAKKGNNKRLFCDEPSTRNKRHVSARQPVTPVITMAPTSATGNLPVVFGASEGNNFEFTFSVSLS